MALSFWGTKFLVAFDVMSNFSDIKVNTKARGDIKVEVQLTPLSEGVLACVCMCVPEAHAWLYMQVDAW